jgi:hypothetical protein
MSSRDAKRCPAASSSTGSSKGCRKYRIEPALQVPRRSERKHVVHNFKKEDFDALWGTGEAGKKTLWDAYRKKHGLNVVKVIIDGEFVGWGVELMPGWELRKDQAIDTLGFYGVLCNFAKDKGDNKVMIYWAYSIYGFKCLRADPRCVCSLVNGIGGTWGFSTKPNCYIDKNHMRAIRDITAPADSPVMLLCNYHWQNDVTKCSCCGCGRSLAASETCDTLGDCPEDRPAPREPMSRIVGNTRSACCGKCRRRRYNTTARDKLERIEKAKKNSRVRTQKKVTASDKRVLNKETKNTSRGRKHKRVNFVYRGVICATVPIKDCQPTPTATTVNS